MLDLNTLIPPGSGLQLTNAININDRGEILAKSVALGVTPIDDEDLGHVVLLIPCEGEDDCKSNAPPPMSEPYRSGGEQPRGLEGLTHSVPHRKGRSRARQQRMNRQYRLAPRRASEVDGWLKASGGKALFIATTSDGFKRFVHDPPLISGWTNKLTKEEICKRTLPNHRLYFQTLSNKPSAILSAESPRHRLFDLSVQVAVLVLELPWQPWRSGGGHTYCYPEPLRAKPHPLWSPRIHAAWFPVAKWQAQGLGHLRGDITAPLAL